MSYNEIIILMKNKEPQNRDTFTKQRTNDNNTKLMG